MRDFTHPVDDADLVERADVGREAGVHTQHTPVDDGLRVWQTEKGGGSLEEARPKGERGRMGVLASHVRHPRQGRYRTSAIDWAHTARRCG